MSTLKDRPTIYVAGPYSSDPVNGLRKAIAAADAIWAAGGAPYVPHLTLFWDIISSKPRDEWLELDLIWLSRCDMLLRLPGKSPGADKEVIYAVRKGIPVHYSRDSCLIECAVCIRHQERCKLCEGCREGWPVHYAGNGLGWVHTQPEELATSDDTPQVWEPCRAGLLQ